MDLEILSAGAAQGMVRALEVEFLASTGAGIKGSFGPVGAIKEKFDASESCDVLVLTGAILAELERTGRVAAGSIAPLGKVGTGVAVRSGEAQPAIGDPQALSACLQQAQGVYVPDPLRSTAGIHFVSILKKLGIHDQVAPKLRPFESGAVAMAALAKTTEANLIGCTQVTEILYTPGVSLVGLLPEALGLSTVYSAAVSSTAKNPELARRFVALLTGSTTQAQRIEDGFEI